MNPFAFYLRCYRDFITAWITACEMDSFTTGNQRPELKPGEMFYSKFDELEESLKP